MKSIIVNEDYQIGYIYNLTEPPGKNYSEDFKPQLTPEQMLKLGIFGGNYFALPPSQGFLIWDKVLGGLTGGTTDPLSPELWRVVMVVIGFYFLYEATRAVVRR